MKRKSMLTAAAIGLATAAFATPSQNNYAAVTNDWYNANFSNVLELAESRLSANSNDIVGVTLKLGYDISFGDASTLSNSVTRFITVADTVTAEAFSNEYWNLRPLEISYRDDFLPTLTTEQIAEDLPKASLPGKRIPKRLYLELLEEGGLW